jgi:Homeodomain-like domain
MSKARVEVSKVLSKQMSVSERPAAHGVSRQHVHRWLTRYRDGGFDGLEPRSRRPHSNPRRTASAVAERIVALRRELAGQGLEHGTQTIGWHLEQEQLSVPSTSTIRRILLAGTLPDVLASLRYDDERWQRRSSRCSRSSGPRKLAAVR